MTRLLAAAMLLLAVPALAEGYDGKGEAPIVNGNKALARQQALASAMRDAVMKAGTTIDSATITEGATLQMDKIFAHASGYVKGYTVADDKDQGDGTYLVALKDVVVGTGELTRDLAAVRASIAAMGHPRLMLMISEQSVEEAAPRGWWVSGMAGQPGKEPAAAVVSSGVVEQGIVQRLSPLGWKFIDPQVAMDKIKVDGALNLTPGKGREFGKAVGAEFVVLGTVIVRPEDAGKGGILPSDMLYPVNSRVVLRVVAVDTGEIVAIVEKSANVPGTISISNTAAKAMDQAAVEVAGVLSKQVLERWRGRTLGDANLHLLVSVADYDVLQGFEQVLSTSVLNVKSVDEVSFNDGKADLSLMVSGGNARQLAGSLSNKSVKGLTVKVVKVTPHSLEVKLVR